MPSVKKQINISLASYPGFEHFKAMETAFRAKGNGVLSEPLWGGLSLDHIQIVPQNLGIFGLDEACLMRETYPDTQFRLHANVRVLPRRAVYDLSNFLEYQEWFKMAAKVQNTLGGDCYSAHAGSRINCSITKMFDNARMAADLFGVPVAIEGLYPDKHNTQLLSTWEEYKALLESGLPYALDLSHLNIVAKSSQRHERNLVQELLCSENCLEIHVSDNDGHGDQHQICTSEVKPWWLDILVTTVSHAVCFTDGNLRRQMPGRPKIN